MSFVNKSVLSLQLVWLCVQSYPQRDRGDRGHKAGSCGIRPPGDPEGNLHNAAV